MSRKSRHTIVASVPEAIETLVATKQRIRENRDRRWRRRRARTKEFLNTEHEFELRIGDKSTKEIKTMYGLEAVTLNREMESVFWKELDTNPLAKLSRWYRTTSG
jgi:hypothetical protein